MSNGKAIMSSYVRGIVIGSVVAAAFWSGRETLAQEKPEEKPLVVIQWGQTAPDTAYLRRYADWMQRRPFDGVGFGIPYRDAGWMSEQDWTHQIEAFHKTKNLDWAAVLERPRDSGLLSNGYSLLANLGPWNSAEEYTDAMLAASLADLQATRFDRFKFNLLVIYLLHPPATDWFDDAEWAKRCRNFAVLARFAKQAGVKGFLFDDEEYKYPIFNYDLLRNRDTAHGRSFEEHRDKARQRGREFAQAICQEFPDIVFWTLHGYGTVASLVECGYSEYRRRLSSPFYDGMLEGSSEQMVFVDGGEVAYYYNTKEHFEYGRKVILEEPIRMKLTQVPDLFRKKVRCGFGIRADYGLDPDNPQMSYFSPGRLQRALYWALKYSDGYVWLYGAQWTWWVEGPDDRAPVEFYGVRENKPDQRIRGFPLAYWKAVQAARSSPGPDTSAIPAGMITNGLPMHGRVNCIDGDALAGYLGAAEKVHELPTEGWTFKLDDWGLPRDDPATFKPIALGKPWDQQGFTGTDSTGWYRFEFTLPAELKGRALDLYFPNVAGSLWLSGSTPDRGIQGVAHRYVELEPQSLGKPFVLQTSRGWSGGLLRPGQPMVLVLKVQRHKGSGGILRPIHVMAPKSPR